MDVVCVCVFELKPFSAAENSAFFLFHNLRCLSFSLDLTRSAELVTFIQFIPYITIFSGTDFQGGRYLPDFESVKSELSYRNCTI